MSETKQCDRCIIGLGGKYGEVTVTFEYPDGIPPTKEYTLCNDCVNKIHNFIKIGVQ